MKKLILILIFAVTAISLNAALVNKSGNIIEVKENGLYHALITIKENASDTAIILKTFSTFIGNKLEFAIDTIKGSKDKFIRQSILEALEIIIIEESKNGGLLKYKPDLDAVLIEELRQIDLK